VCGVICIDRHNPGLPHRGWSGLHHQLDSGTGHEFLRLDPGDCGKRETELTPGPYAPRLAR
jgi:hypothetical protein